MTLSYAVQAHPRRRRMAEALAETIGGEVVYDPLPDDPHPGPWRSYRAALEATPPDATHRVVVQDDAEPHPGMLEALPRAVEARPDRLIALFVPGRMEQHRWAMWTAGDAGSPWVELPNHDRATGRPLWCPTVGTCWPVDLIGQLLDWFDQEEWPHRFLADDEIVGRFLAATGLRALATVPSLVEHPDLVPSVIGKRGGLGWVDPARVAACFNPDCDVAAIDWT